MKKKIIPAQKALVKTVRTSLQNIVAGIGNWPDQLMADANKNGLSMAGAMVYIYKGFDDKPDTVFELQMCLPVVDYATYHGEFEAKEIAEFSCVESMYVGSMPDLAQKGWAAFMSKASNEQTSFSQEAREVYVKWLGFHSPENQVLLQMGLRK